MPSFQKLALECVPRVEAVGMLAMHVSCVASGPAVQKFQSGIRGHRMLLGQTPGWKQRTRPGKCS